LINFTLTISQLCSTRKQSQKETMNVKGI